MSGGHLSASDGWSISVAGSPKSNGEQGNLTWKDAHGPLSIHRIVADAGVFYRIRLDADIAVDVLPNRRLATHFRPGSCRNTFDHFMADQVIPRALAGEGRLVIHAGAIIQSAAAILLLGASGRGKSTLTTSFYTAGHAMLGDDAIVISGADNCPTATAVYPSLRLLPDSIQALVPDRFETDHVSQNSSKRRLRVLLDGVQRTSAPVSALFALAAPRGEMISVRRLGPAEASMVVVQNSFALDPADVGAASRRLTQASALARAIPAFEIAYPREYARLPEVRGAISKALEEIDAHPRLGGHR